MAKNSERRRALADAGLHVLAREGARGLTHRAVDAEAGVPTGTSSNYFRNRDALLRGLVERITERLAPSEEFLAERRGLPPSRELFAEYVRSIVDRLLGEREVTIALFELRLESIRRPEVSGSIVEWRRRGFDGDVEFNSSAGLPGGRSDIALFHYAIDGFLFDRLTGAIEPGRSTNEVVDALVDRLLPR